MNNFDFYKWMSSLYTPDQKQGWQSYWNQHKPSYWEQYANQWQQLYKQAESLLGMQPDSSEVQILCAKWLELVDKMFKDNPMLRSSTWDAMRSSMHSQFEFFNQTVLEFMEQAFKFYNQKVPNQ